MPESFSAKQGVGVFCSEELSGLQTPWLSHHRQEHHVNMQSAAGEIDIWEDGTHNGEEMLCGDDARGVWLYLRMFNSIGHKGTLWAIGERKPPH